MELVLSGNYKPSEIIRFMGDPRMYVQDGSQFTPEEQHLLDTQEEVFLEVFEMPGDDQRDFFQISPVVIFNC